MKDFIKTLLGIGLTVGLADRDAFVKNVSGLMQQYQDDPEKAEKWAKAIANYLEQMKDNVNLQNSIKSAVGESGLTDPEKVAELTVAIKDLTKEFQKYNGKK